VRETLELKFFVRFFVKTHSGPSGPVRRRNHQLLFLPGLIRINLDAVDEISYSVCPWGKKIWSLPEWIRL